MTSPRHDYDIKHKQIYYVYICLLVLIKFPEILFLPKFSQTLTESVVRGNLPIPTPATFKGQGQPN